MKLKLILLSLLLSFSLESCGTYTEHSDVSLEPVAGATSPFSPHCQVIKINDLTAFASEKRFQNARYPVYLGRIDIRPETYQVECGIMENGVYKTTGKVIYGPNPGQISFGSPEGTAAQNVAGASEIMWIPKEGIYPYVVNFKLQLAEF